MEWLKKFSSKFGLFDDAGHTAGVAHMPVCWCCGEDVDFAQRYRPVLPFCSHCVSERCRKCRSSVRVRKFQQDPTFNLIGCPRGPRVRCGWGCGAQLTASRMRLHFTVCPKRPRARKPRGRPSSKGVRGAARHRSGQRVDAGERHFCPQPLPERSHPHDTQSKRKAIESHLFSGICSEALSSGAKMEQKPKLHAAHGC